ncbi:MAG: cyclic nucleotide-binding domain-containing protein [Deltaproteobacteria bacterium]|nr:cyclic nucleotide-binding domain-containing protein [Deltaproteobacteria bacterium]
MFATNTQVLVTQLGQAFPRLSESLSPADVQKLGRMGDRVLLLENEDLVPAGGRLPGLILILRGRLVPRAAPDVPEEHRWVLGPGEAIGIEALVGRQPRHDSLRALEFSELRVFDAKVWGHLLERTPHIAVGFLHALARELAEEVDALAASLERLP